MFGKRKNKSVRLEKKETLWEKIEKWIDSHVYIFICAGIVVIIILLVVICIALMPGTESGLWYNNRTGLI